ncbi:putative F420-dependent oxidoreductase [Novosphingobium chloroacetimidivorans]|uniref:Putative F420-dependent oxidoreductase n=1 Tax=Novosphingobium chloroacetimidivorans TaxID=1428314 RepID=A0A7W7K8W2_9SPHN|nr:LLM class F420-dependent oxidoreductase [Novosphingobium chloroacetimidivorans]MBB4857698.1 putative F420-dependent oxidoreductase [Novosphingobium chloroacetimidivorans]
MKIGAAYPTTEVAGDPQAIRKFCAAAEDLGFAHMMAYDHVVKCPHDGRDPKLTGPYTDEDTFHDPFTLFSFAAAITTSLEFVTGVLVLPQRQTALVAQQAADVDLFSGERLRLGVGIGWNYVEYEALGQDFKTRARRIEEQVDLLRQLWTTPLVDFHGRFDRIDRAGINPRPRRAIPLWLGGHSEPAYERGACIGDGFVFAAPGEGAVDAWNRVRHHLHEAGRDEDSFGRDLLAIFARDAQEAADHLKRWRDAGGTHGTAPSMNKGLGDDIDAHIDYLAKVKRLVDAG